MSEYLLSVIHGDDNAVPEGTDFADVVRDVDAFNAELQAQGAWVFAGGLHPISAATTVDGTGAEPVITDGPYAETKEYLGGFWVIQAADLDEALAWAAKGSKACVHAGRGPALPGRVSASGGAPDAALDQAIAEAVRAEHARVVGSLVRRFGDVGLAEDATGEAVVAAVETWRRDGVPPNPGGWLTTTAVRRALDRLRREQSRPQREREADRMDEASRSDALPLGVVDDDRLRLLFMCCHPALAPDVRVALTLRLVAGLTMPEIGRALLTPGADGGPAA